jgi:hypothetical protein
MADVVINPKYNKKDLIRISPFDQNGRPKNEFARKAIPYVSQVAEILSVNLYEKAHKPILVYRVKTEEGSVVLLTEDCLMAVKNERY